MPWPTVVLTILLVVTMAGCSLTGTQIPQSACYKSTDLDPRIEAAIDEFRASTPAKMREAKVPGCAIALVDGTGVLWTEGFGYTDRTSRIPVTPDTGFLICSISKTITATAILLAVQDGLLDLDAPITTYLPDFEMNSRYEECPGRKITLRRLLSHTAGLPLDAPIGNIFQVTGSFDEHVRSIYGTWLDYPVGQAFSYSNIGVDVAAYALQAASGMPFDRYVREHLLSPLGMTHTALAPREILACADRAAGHTTGFAEMPSVIPAIGAGGIQASAADLSKFVQLHLNRGIFEGRRLLDESLVDAMYVPQARTAEPNVYDGLGVGIADRDERGRYHLGHGGTGYGFEARMAWYPEYGIGEVILTNRMPNPAIADLSIVDRLIRGGVVVKRASVPTVDCVGCVSPWGKWPGHAPSAYRRDWREYCGTYDLTFGGCAFEWWAQLALALLTLDDYTPRLRVYEEGGYLRVKESRFFEKFLKKMWARQVAEPLEEVRPGLFFTASGAALDFRSQPPRWRNYRLKKR